MPRASWRGFLRLSLESCPIYLSPATTRAKPFRLHQVWRPDPVDVDEDALADRGEGQQGSAPSAPRLLVRTVNAFRSRNNDGPLFFDTVDRFMVCSIYEGLITLEMGAANAGRQSLRGNSIMSVALTNSKN
jgi:hypothetical protein